jgi:hypothetical protein
MLMSGRKSNNATRKIHTDKFGNSSQCCFLMNIIATEVFAFQHFYTNRYLFFAPSSFLTSARADKCCVLQLALTVDM